MSYTPTGACQRCGAPIYVPFVWHGVIPLPPTYTCSCNGTGGTPGVTITPTTARPNPDMAKVWERLLGEHPGTIECAICGRRLKVEDGKVPEHATKKGASGVCFGSGGKVLDSEVRR